MDKVQIPTVNLILVNEKLCFFKQFRLRNKRWENSIVPTAKQSQFWYNLGLDRSSSRQDAPWGTPTSKKKNLNRTDTRHNITKVVIHHWLICLISQTLIQKANAVYFKVNSVAIRTLFIAIFSHGADRINLGKDWRGMNVLCVFCLRKNTGKTYCFNFELLLIV